VAVSHTRLRKFFSNKVLKTPERLSSAHCKDDVAGLVLRFDVPGGFHHVFQRVATVDDRPVLTRLDELLEQEDVLLRVARR
jgi:hypothetical protein